MLLQIPPEYLKKAIFWGWVFFWCFQGIFPISCCRVDSDVVVVFLAYFGVWGIFFSVADNRFSTQDPFRIMHEIVFRDWDIKSYWYRLEGIFSNFFGPPWSI